MPNHTTIAAEHDALLIVSGCWEVTDPQPAQPLRCWQETRRVGAECELVRRLRAENEHLRLTVEDQRKRLVAASDCCTELFKAHQELRTLNNSLAEKLAICSELLGKRAERREPDTLAVVKAAEEAAK